jgi:hypothetical protein
LKIWTSTPDFQETRFYHGGNDFPVDLCVVLNITGEFMARVCFPEQQISSVRAYSASIRMIFNFFPKRLLKSRLL